MSTETEISTAAPSALKRLNWVDSFLFAVKLVSAFVILWGLLGYIVLANRGEALTAELLRDLIISGIAQGSMYG